MENFLGKVLKAVEELGKAPYDDKKTEEALLEQTRKTLSMFPELLEKYKAIEKKE